MGTVKGLNHVGLSVSDLDVAVGFFRDVMGLELMGSGEVTYPHLDEIIGIGPTRLRWAELTTPGEELLELFQYMEPEGKAHSDQRTCDPGTVHVCFECDDVAAVLTRATDAGYLARTASAVRIPFGDWEGWLCVYVVGPDSITIELVQRPEGASPGVPGAAARRRDAR